MAPRLAVDSWVERYPFTTFKNFKSAARNPANECVHDFWRDVIILAKCYRRTRDRSWALVNEYIPEKIGAFFYPPTLLAGTKQRPDSE